MYILLGLLSSFAVFARANECSVENSMKTDCGFEGVTASSCEAKGCCWSEVNDYSTPWCYDATGVNSPGYDLVGGKMTTVSTGYKGTLQRVQTIRKHRYYGEDIDTLTVELLLEDSDYVRMKIYPSDGNSWEIPQSIVARPDNVPKATLMNYDVTYTSSPFTIKVTRKSDSKVIFSSSQELFFKDQYIEFTTAYDASAKTYGLGESTRLNHALKTENSIYTLWASDTPAAVQNVNLYSSFPMYLQMLDGAAHGGMMMNSNGMDVVLGSSSLTYKMLGGIIDFYVFVGSTPIDVMAQYTSVVGRPTMQPYWAYGFHNCKYGYESISQVEDVVAGYADAGIPLDTQWLDIDYMQNYRDFTWDSKNFPIAEVQSFVNTLHNNSQHFVTIVDPGIMIYENYDAYIQGMKDDIFIKDITGEPYLGQVWPGPTYFPDFTHPKSTDYWTTQLQQFIDDVNVDGIWIDMNEVSNFCNDDGKGQSCVNSAPNGCPSPGASQTDCCLVCTEVDATNKYDYPEYHINNNKGLLSVKTLSMSSTQYGNTSVYDTHNLYGLTEQIATNAALTSVRSKRPFLLSRSAFLSTGRHSAKWTGDNAANWDDLKSSIVSIMDFTLFGVPMIGADICGFLDDTTEELCARWIEVGAFYPFSRNHNALGQAPQELYLWDSVSTASKTYLNMRYRLLPYYYTLQYGASNDGRSTLATALWMNFPTDEVVVELNYQFMIGSAIMISPVVEMGETSVNAYFPNGLWYNMNDGYKLAVDATVGTAGEGMYVELDTPLTSTNVHLYGGKTVPMQEAAMTTALARTTPFTLLVALCPGGKSYGSLYWDNGEDVTVKDYLTVAYTTETSLEAGDDLNYISGIVSTHGDISAFNMLKISTIIVTSSSLAAPSNIMVGTKNLSTNSIVYDKTNHILTLSDLDLAITEDFKITWE